MAKILDGKKLSRDILEKCAERSRAFVEKSGRRPQLTMIYVGDDPASAIYVRNKEKAARKAGVDVTTRAFPSEVTEEFLSWLIDMLNRSDDVDGIMVQMPLPAHINARRLIDRIRVDKDADGLTSENQGRIITGRKGLIPCTAKGVVRLLKENGIELTGRSCAIFGRSTLVGKPLAALLTNENCTVTLCHTKTDDITKFELLTGCDIIVCAVGMPHFVARENIAYGQTLVDVGINRLEDGTVVGDISPECYADAYAYTPVPGGVGPMTVAMLIENTIEAAEEHVL